MWHKYCSPSPKICGGPAWIATESTCAILYCVNFFNMCIIINSYCSFSRYTCTFAVSTVYVLFACCRRHFLLFLIIRSQLRKQHIMLSTIVYVVAMLDLANTRCMLLFCFFYSIQPSMHMMHMNRFFPISVYSQLATLFQLFNLLLFSI